MLRDVPVQYEHAEGLLELRVPQLEQVYGIVVVTYLLNLGPFKGHLWKIDGFLFA